MGDIGHAWRGLLSRGMAGACALAFAAAASGAEPVAGKEKVLEQARARYYSLRAEGLSEFRCSVVPNWDLALAKVRRGDPKEADRELKILQASHFGVAVPAYGDPAIVPASAAESPAEQDERSAVEYHKAQKMARSLFLVWAGSVSDPLLPKPGAEYTLEEEPSQYRFIFHDGTTDAETVTDREMLIKSVRLTQGKFAMVFSPEFKKVAGGLLPSSYDLSYPGLPQEDQLRIRTVLDYQLVDGFQLPGKLTLTATGGGESDTFEFSFVDCHASRRDALAPAGVKR